MDKEEKSEASDKEKTEEGYKMKIFLQKRRRRYEKLEIRRRQKAKDVDVKEHIDGCPTSGESDLSEEFKEKTILFSA